MKNSEAVSWTAAASPGNTELLYGDVAMGLHAASQPLTVLRAGLCPKNVQALTRAELLEFAETCAEAVERTCLLFNLTRELVNTEGMDVEIHPYNLNVALQEIEERCTRDFQESGLKLRCCFENAPAPVLGSRFLTSRALTIALHLIRSFLKRGDGAVLRGRGAGSSYEIVVEASSGLPGNSADTELHLAVMKSLLRKQQATFTCAADPFRLRVQLKHA
ncbi:MAG: hypothetical protein ACLGPM_10735 [Acidobacteriota bacterium]